MRYSGILKTISSILTFLNYLASIGKPEGVLGVSICKPVCQVGLLSGDTG